MKAPSCNVPLLRPTAFLAVGLACIAVAGCGSSHSQPRTVDPLSKLDVKLQAPAQLRRATPQFALRDSLGRIVHLSQFRGKAVVLTFIYDHCPDVCPLIVSNLHNALLKLGPAASKLQIIAVSVDPRGDTPTTIRAFLAAHEMTGRMEYLIGTFRQLAPVWRAYGVEVLASPEKREVSHSAFLYGITGRASVLVLYPPTFDPAWIAHDAPLLASYPSGPSPATGSASSLDSGLHARVLVGPTCPVQRVGQSCIRPYQATISILREPKNSVVATARSAADGRFSVRLTPGRYLLEPHAGRPFPTSRPQTATVYAHRFTDVIINYDSGIR
jgi:protein SCO1